MPAKQPTKLVMSTAEIANARVLTAEGCLDGTTYLPLRDAIIKAALDEPAAVIIDVTALLVPAPSAWAAFTSARWHIGQWPDVPIALVCAHRGGRTAITRNGVARYVPVYPSTPDAIAAITQWHQQPVRRRARADLPRTPGSAHRARQLVDEWLTHWSRTELISVAKLVVTVLVENVLAHTESTPTVRLESMDELVTIAVDDHSSVPAARKEISPDGGEDVSGLAIVAALCRKWGNLPTPSGKTVWAALGPENQI